MWAAWRSFELTAARHLRRVYPSSAQARAGDYYLSDGDDDLVPLDLVNQPLLLGEGPVDRDAYHQHHHNHSSLSSNTSSSDPFPVRLLSPSPSSSSRRRRSKFLTFFPKLWRSKYRTTILLIVAFILLACSPTLLKFLHLYSDPGYDDKFLRPLYTPLPHAIEDLVPPVSIPELSSSSKRSYHLAEAPLDHTRERDGNGEDDTDGANRLETLLPILQNELASRLDKLGMPAYENHTHCSSLDSTAVRARYAHLAAPTRGRTLIGLNLYNAKLVLPSIGRSLLPLAQFLGPKNVLVSIFENGSDDGTTEGLAHLAAVMTAAGIPHRVVSDDRKTMWENVDRISQLALYRNVVLDPLFPSSSNGTNAETEEKPFENVIFVNDVFFCPTDALELLHVRAAQQAHATCGLDWRWRHNSMPSVFGTGPKVRVFFRVFLGSFFVRRNSLLHFRLFFFFSLHRLNFLFGTWSRLLCMVALLATMGVPSLKNEDRVAGMITIQSYRSLLAG